MAAKGSKVMVSFEEELGRFRHALDYAPGMDYPNVEVDDWEDLSNNLNAFNESLLKAKRHAKCIEQKTNATTTEDIRAGRSADELYEIIKICRQDSG